MKRHYDSAATTRLAAAVREVESRSCAELVLEIQSRSGSYAHADARFGALLAFISLAAVLGLPVSFPPYALIIDTVAFFFIGLAISKRSKNVRRLMTSNRERVDAVRARAAALFFERGLANTSEETGLLLFVSLLEQRAELLADRGLLRLVPPEEWNAVRASIHSTRQFAPDDVIAIVQRLGAILHVCAPASGENLDELTSLPQLDLT